MTDAKVWVSLEGSFRGKDLGCLERNFEFFLVQPKLRSTLSVFPDKRLT